MAVRMAEQNEGENVTLEPQTLNLICIDTSEHSKRALVWYFEFHHREGDQVGLVHVCVPPDLPPFGLYASGMAQVNLYEKSVKHSVEASKGLVEEYKTMCVQKGVTPKCFNQSVNDSIGHTVCEVAKDNNATMVVIGHRGLGAIRRTFIGSVSDYIIHHTHIPVLLVPPEKK